MLINCVLTKKISVVLGLRNQLRLLSDFFGAPEQRKPETVKHKALKNWGLQLRVSALPDRQKIGSGFPLPMSSR